MKKFFIWLLVFALPLLFIVIWQLRKLPHFEILAASLNSNQPFQSSLARTYLKAMHPIRPFHKEGSPLLILTELCQNRFYESKCKELFLWYKDQGLNLNETSGPRGFAPLHLATFFGDVEVVKFLIQEGADLNVVTNSPQSEQLTPLNLLNSPKGRSYITSQEQLIILQKLLGKE